MHHARWCNNGVGQFKPIFQVEGNTFRPKLRNSLPFSSSHFHSHCPARETRVVFPICMEFPWDPREFPTQTDLYCRLKRYITAIIVTQHAQDGERQVTSMLSRCARSVTQCYTGRCYSNTSSLFQTTTSHRRSCVAPSNYESLPLYLQTDNNN